MGCLGRNPSERSAWPCRRPESLRPRKHWGEPFYRAALARRPRGRPQPAAAPALTRAGLPLSFRFLGVSLLSYLTSSRSRRKEEMVERTTERGREEEREMEGGRERRRRR